MMEVIDEISGMVDVMTFERVLKEVNIILDEELVFYSYDVDLLCNHVITSCGPQTSTE